MIAEYAAAATFAVGLLAGTPHAASAPHESQGTIRLADSLQAQPITLRACNRTSDIVQVASSFVAVGDSDWTNKGWVEVKPGDCEDIFVTTNPTFYARAEVKDDELEYWGKDVKQCDDSGPYNFKTSSGDTTCPQGDPAYFKTFKSEDNKPVYIWNLDLADRLDGMSDHSDSQQTQTFTLRACNRTSGKVEVASSFIAVGDSDWTNKGWTGVESGACEDIFVTTNPTFYARAEVAGDSDSYWGPDTNQCVEYPGPYNFKTSTEATSCPEGEPVMFATFKSNGKPVYVWNLDP